MKLILISIWDVFIENKTKFVLVHFDLKKVFLNLEWNVFSEIWMWDNFFFQSFKRKKNITRYSRWTYFLFIVYITFTKYKNNISINKVITIYNQISRKKA